MGYPFAPGKELSVSIDGGPAIRIPVDDEAGPEDDSLMWHESPEVNAKLVKAMRGRAQDGRDGALEAGDEDRRHLFASGVFGGLQGHLASLRRTLTACLAALSAGILEAAVEPDRLRRSAGQASHPDRPISSGRNSRQSTPGSPNARKYGLRSDSPVL